MIYRETYFKMNLYVIVMILSVLYPSSVGKQEDYWPIHTACKSDKLEVTYRSCDPIQDIGFTLSSCTDIQTQSHMKISILLRQSIDEFYLSVDLFHNGVMINHYYKPICLPNFPHFTFCGNRRGEMITVKMTLSEIKLRLKGSYTFKIHGINQNGFQIMCVNVTGTFQ